MKVVTSYNDFEIPVNAMKKYQTIMQMVRNNNVKDEQFRRIYVGFYKVRRNLEFRNLYFEILSSNLKKLRSFKEVLIEIYNGTGRIEPSFTSKLIATCDDHAPIWDKYILENLGYKSRFSKNKETRIEECIQLYQELCDWYIEYEMSDEGKKMISFFDKKYPEFITFSNTKKIDFILWSCRNE